MLKDLRHTSVNLICAVMCFLHFCALFTMGKIAVATFSGSPYIWGWVITAFFAVNVLGYFYAIYLCQITKYKITRLAFSQLLFLSLLILSHSFLANFATLEPVCSVITICLLWLGVSSTLFIQFNQQQIFKEKTNINSASYSYKSVLLSSIIAFIIYPFIVETVLVTKEQLAIIGYALIGLPITFIIVIFNFKKESESTDNNTESAYLSLVLSVLFLSAIPTALLIGFSNFVTTDLPASPLLWFAPLALYSLTLLAAFNKRTFFSLRYSYFLQATVIFLFICFCMMNLLHLTYFMWLIQFLLFFLTCLVCHHELHKIYANTNCRNSFRSLAFVGAFLGAFLMALCAPVLFSYPWEYILCLCLSLFFRYRSDEKQPFKQLKISLKTNEFWTSSHFIAAVSTLFFGVCAALLPLSDAALIIVTAFACFGILFLFDKRWLFAISASVLLLLHPTARWDGYDNILTRERNIHGVVTVQDNFLGIENLRALYHGSAVQGLQSLQHNGLSEPYKETALQDVISYISSQSYNVNNIGVIGLGDGSLSCLGDDYHFDFYEANPAIVRFSTEPSTFSYLEECGGDYTVINGNARDNLNFRERGVYDVLIVNARSSNSIPTHFITEDAFKLYEEKTREDGIIVVNLTNRYMDLSNEIALIAKSLNLELAIKTSDFSHDKDHKMVYLPASYAVLTKDKDFINGLVGTYEGWTSDFNIDDESHLKPWTDDHSFVLRSLSIFN